MAAAPDLPQLAEMLRPAVLKLTRHLRREAQRFGVSTLDAQLLAEIKRKPGIGISELARIERMSSPSMSAHVKRIEAAGLVTRGADPDGDRRRTRLVIAPAGEAAMASIRQSRNDWLATRLATLDEEERAALAAGIAPLRRLAEAHS